jgi:hypothetical protein
MSLPCSEFIYDPEQPTDLEIALRILQLIDDRQRFKGMLGRRRQPADGREAIFGLAKSAAQTMTNPYARKLLLDKLAEQ